MPVVRSYQRQTLPEAQGLTRMPLGLGQMPKLDPKAAAGGLEVLARGARQAADTGMEAAGIVAQAGGIRAQRLNALARLTQDLGETFYHVGQTLDATRAQNSFERELTEAALKVRQEGDPEGAPQAIRSKAQELLGRHGQGLAGRYALSFRRQAQSAALRTELAVTEWARKEQVGLAQAELGERENLLAAQFAAAPTTGQRDLILEQHGLKVDDYAAKGILGPKAAAKRKAEFRNQLTVTEFTMAAEQAADQGEGALAALTALKDSLKGTGAWPALKPGQRITLAKALDTRLKIARAEAEERRETAALAALQDQHGDDWAAMAAKANDGRWLKSHGLDLTSGARLSARISALETAAFRERARRQEQTDRALTSEVVALVKENRLDQASRRLHLASGASAGTLNSLDAYLGRRVKAETELRRHLAGALITESMLTGRKLDWTTADLLNRGAAPQDVDNLLKTQAEQWGRREQAVHKGLPNQLSKAEQDFRGVFKAGKDGTTAYRQALPGFRQELIQRMRAENLDPYDSKLGEVARALRQEVEIDVPGTPFDYEGLVLGIDVRDADLAGMEPAVVREVHYYLARQNVEPNQENKRAVALAIEKLRERSKPVNSETIGLILSVSGETLAQEARERWL